MLYFSLEMSRQEISNRVLFCHAGIDRSKLRAKPPRSGGFLNQSDWSALANSGILKRAPMLIDDAVGLTVPQMRAKIGQAQAYFAKQGKALCTVVIDHTLKMRGTNRSRFAASRSWRSLVGSRILQRASMSLCSS